MTDKSPHADATAGEAAYFLRCCVKTVYRRVADGQLRAFRYTKRGPLLIEWTELRAFRTRANQKGTHNESV